MIRQQPKEHIANSNNKAKKHNNNKIDAAAWIDSLCKDQKKFKFDSNKIKFVGDIVGYIYGNRVLNTYYELTARYDNCNDGWIGFCLGIADASYKNKLSIAC